MIFAALFFLFIQSGTAKEKPLVPPPQVDKTHSNYQSLMRGKDYLENTAIQLKDYTGAQLNCTSCHLQSGSVANTSPWVGITAQYPKFSARTAKMETLAQRINDCFERSMNGKALPEKGPLEDILNYMAWLSKDYKKGDKVAGSGIKLLVLKRPPNLEKGKQIYSARCVACHEVNGAGMITSAGDVMFPPLWGDTSFNIGAGMARQYTAAGFVKAKMPLGAAGSLTDEEAWDVAAYFTQQPRPDFPGKAKDWPKGGKPKDARY